MSSGFFGPVGLGSKVLPPLSMANKMGRVVFFIMIDTGVEKVVDETGWRGARFFYRCCSDFFHGTRIVPARRTYQYAQNWHNQAP